MALKRQAQYRVGGGHTWAKGGSDAINLDVLVGLPGPGMFGILFLHDGAQPLVDWGDSTKNFQPNAPFSVSWLVHGQSCGLG